MSLISNMFGFFEVKLNKLVFFVPMNFPLSKRIKTFLGILLLKLLFSLSLSVITVLLYFLWGGIFEQS